MNKAQDGLYEIELRRVASRLDLGRTGNIEDKIIGHCLECLRRSNLTKNETICHVHT